MKVRVFYPNKDNKIIFTKEQLEKLLDEVYEEGRAYGYNQGYNANRPISITYPYTPYWYTTNNNQEIDITPTITCTADPLTSSTTTSTSGYITALNQDSNIKVVSIGDEE